MFAINILTRSRRLSKSILGSLRNVSLTSERKSPITSASLDTPNETVKVCFNNGLEYEYPWPFLQDNCTCPECFHVSSQSRKRLMTNLNLDNHIVSVSTLCDSSRIKCIWSDGHEGEFDENWLQERNFSKENFRRRKMVLRDDLTFINSVEHIQRCEFEEIMSKPPKLLAILQALCKFGVVLIENAPKEIGQLKKVVEKIAFIRTTHYGILRHFPFVSNEFTVKSEPNPSNIAYTSTPLCVHTDLPYYVYPPGIQLLHCITQYHGSDGAHTHLVDGFLVANQMKDFYADSYKLLSEIDVEFADIGEDYTKFHKIHHSPTFVHSNNGQLTRIVYSNQQLSSTLPVPLQNVKDLYRALKLFTTLCYDEKNLMKFKLKEGDILIFDNWRMLHGREGFDPMKGKRHLEGCYIDWDEVYSTVRVLQNSSFH